ncbi:hypothetical protein [Pseudomonas sp. NFACC37-1]|uniref:hypothetical protein n=1 Tax=Pseudomonas sp. NFACC37-1 TaxID=1566196 RepID=UPI0008903FD2|nr:hypothetical protein [Pseudomonas sp. NFACC37-1]SCZ13266.1 hypothetical protein SAMN03159391_05805 [Pseudomonas sp. NFACC37-1]
MSEQQRIAQDATFQITCAMEHINWLRGVLHVLEDRLIQGHDEHYATVANLAIFNADDWHNQLDAERETLEMRAAAAFEQVGVETQNVMKKNVSRKRGGDR